MNFVVMGVAGSGKSTIGRLLARRLGIPFFDGDDFHPPANVAKMSQGIPLTDSDRAGWLDALAAVIAEHSSAGGACIIACSALKESYRDRLRAGGPVRFVYLRGDPDLLLRRLQERTSHFMRPEMLVSQLATLEEPADAIVVDIDQSPERIVEAVVAAL